MSDAGTGRAAPHLVAAAWTLVVAVVMYAAIRSAQKLFTHEANPATVIWAAHSGYFWRSLTVAYVSGATYVVALLAARRAPDRTAYLLPGATLVAAAAIALQAIFAP